MKELKGSKRCILELISSADYISKMNSLMEPTGAEIGPADLFMPRGLHDHTEAELKNFLSDHFNLNLGQEIANWWLAFTQYRTPKWDLVSTCIIDGNRGILLVEVKAHCGELNEESHGKRLNKKKASEDTIRNHIKIGEAINEAKEAINISFPKVSISRDNCYQLSNRVAHAWWLACHDIPVVLMYLGFLDAEDMNYGGRVIFRTHEEWETCFLNHSSQVGVDGIVDEWVDCGQSEFKLIVRSIESNI